MNALWLIGTLGVLGVTNAQAQGQAPFCVVAGGYTQCTFYDAPACRRNAASVGGMCVANQQQAQAQPSFSPLDAMRHIQEQGERGRQAGMERREHEARTNALDAQTAAAIAADPIVEGPRVTYTCFDPDGQPFQTVNVPIVGCVVSAIGF